MSVTEHAEDRSRGELRHVQANIALVLKIRRESMPCAASGCTTRATAAMDGRALCTRHADDEQRRSTIRRDYAGQPGLLRRALKLDESMHR